jgi:hypothetical protein
MHCIWGLIAQRLMRPLAVVERKVFRQSNQQFTHAGIAIEVHVLVFDAAPQALDKDIVKCPAPSSLVCGGFFAFERTRESLAGELRALGHC